MSVKLQYLASSGNVYNLKGDGLRTKKANYHNWNWGVDGTTLQFGMRIAAFKKAVATYETQLIFTGSVEKRRAMVDALHDDFEHDIRVMKPGRIIWGDYYIDCYATVSSTEPDNNALWTDNNVTFYCPYPFWIHESSKSFLPQDDVESDQEYLEYPLDYKYDYFVGFPGTGKWVRDFPWRCEFKMIIYGPCIDPTVTVNGYNYTIYDTLEENDYVVIDSRDYTVNKYLASGMVQNIFDLRDKSRSVFEQIPEGTLTLNWSGTFGFELTLFEERSEPKWTT